MRRMRRDATSFLATDADAAVVYELGMKRCSPRWSILPDLLKYVNQFDGDRFESRRYTNGAYLCNDTCLIRIQGCPEEICWRWFVGWCLLGGKLKTYSRGDCFEHRSIMNRVNEQGQKVLSF